MTDIVTNISIHVTKHPDSFTDKEVLSVITNSFSNLVSKAEFLDKVTKVKLLFLWGWGGVTYIKV